MIHKVEEHIENSKEQYIELLRKYSAQPSISSDPVETPICAALIKNMMDEIGIKTQLFETAGQPVVYGEVNSKKADAKTVLFYGHYDVQPVEPLELWLSEPFKPEIRDGKMYGRGTADNKGQHLAHILAVNSYLKADGQLPTNVKFILEGEEECGSTNLPAFVAQHSKLLAADIVYVSDGAIHESGAPRISYGNRGIIMFSITVETAVKDNHSGNRGGVIPNAGWELNRLLSTMLDRDGHVLIHGFYDEVIPPTKYEEELIKNLPFEPEKIAKIFGVNRIYNGKRDYFMNLLFRPTLTINGFGCGEPTVNKTIIPGKAVAKMDIRLVVDQDGDTIYQRIVDHINKQDVRGKVTVNRLEQGMLPAKTSPDLPICRTIVKSVEDAFESRVVEIPATGGSLPNYIWTKILKTPFILVPYGNPDETNHAPNENMSLDCFFKGIKASARVICDLGK